MFPRRSPLNRGRRSGGRRGVGVWGSVGGEHRHLLPNVGREADRRPFKMERLGLRRRTRTTQPAVGPAWPLLLSIWHGFSDDRSYVGWKVALIGLLLLLMGVIR